MSKNYQIKPKKKEEASQNKEEARKRQGRRQTRKRQGKQEGGGKELYLFQKVHNLKQLETRQKTREIT